MHGQYLYEPMRAELNKRGAVSAPCAGLHTAPDGSVKNISCSVSLHTLPNTNIVLLSGLVFIHPNQLPGPPVKGIIPAAVDVLADTVRTNLSMASTFCPVCSMLSLALRV